MSYNILKTDGTLLTTIQDGFLDSTTSLSLPGPDYVGYGQYLNENLVYLLENFAGNNHPSGQSIEGQLWWDKYNKILNVYNGVNYTPVAGTVVSSLTPAVPTDGMIWYNTNTGQLSLYHVTSQNPAGWNVIGPQVQAAFPVTIGDASISAVNHNIIELQAQGQTIAILSSDAQFSPSPPIYGFPVISPGITFANSIQNAAFRGTITGNVASLQGTNPVVVDTSKSVAVFTGNLVGNVAGGNITGGIISGTHTGTFTGTTVAGTVVTASTSVQTPTVTAGIINAATIGNSGAVLYGTLNSSSAAQTNITSLGTLTGLTVGTSGSPATTNFYGSAYLNGVAIATQGGSASFTSINNTPIGSIQPSTGGFTSIIASGDISSATIGGVTQPNATLTNLTVNGTLTATAGSASFGSLSATTVNSGTIGKTDGTSAIIGQISSTSAVQNNITQLPTLTKVGTLTAGSLGTGFGVVQPAQGGTGIANTYTLTVTGANRTLNQDVSSGAAPSFVGTNFSSIPAAAITGLGSSSGTITGIQVNNLVSGLNVYVNAGISGTGTSVSSGVATISLSGTITPATATTSALGIVKPDNSTITISNGVLSAVQASGMTNATSTVFVGSINNGTQSTNTMYNVSVTNQLSMPNSQSWNSSVLTCQAIHSNGDITAFYNSSDVRLKENLTPITGALDKALQLAGYHYNYIGKTDKLVGLLAGDVLKVLPEATYEFTPPGIEEDKENPYMAVRYDLMVPLLLEAIKELNAKVEELQAKVK